MQYVCPKYTARGGHSETMFQSLTSDAGGRNRHAWGTREAALFDSVVALATYTSYHRQLHFAQSLELRKSKKKCRLLHWRRSAASHPGMELFLTRKSGNLSKIRPKALAKNCWDGR